MKVPCLLDANTIIKYYINLPGSEVVKYLFDRSPSAEINITNVQVAEVISVFYKFHRTGVITSDLQLEEFKDTFFNDIKIGKITRFAFVDEHILDFDVYRIISDVPPPGKKTIYEKHFGGYIQLLKDLADTGDAIMLMIMREINFLAEGQCYLFTSDGHVKKVAAALSLNVIDPENIEVKKLPFALTNQRAQLRYTIDSICVVCSDTADEKRCLGSSSTIDISEAGMRIRGNSNMMHGRKIVFKLSPYNDRGLIVPTEGEVVWNTRQEAGVLFRFPLSNGMLCQLKKHCNYLEN